MAWINRIEPEFWERDTQAYMMWRFELCVQYP